MSLRRRMTDGFDVVAIGIQDVGAVVVGVTDLAHAWTTVVRPARGDGGRMKGVNPLAAGGLQGDMESAVYRLALSLNPEGRPLSDSDSEAGSLTRRLDHQGQPQRGKSLLEPLAA